MSIQPTSKTLIPSDDPRIVATPGTCGGKPRINGHRIRVQDIVVWHERQKMSPEEIVREYPGLTLDDVASALNYFHNHADEIEGTIDEAANGTIALVV